MSENRDFVKHAWPFARTNSLKALFPNKPSVQEFEEMWKCAGAIRPAAEAVVQAYRQDNAVAFGEAVDALAKALEGRA